MSTAGNQKKNMNRREELFMIASPLFYKQYFMKDMYPRRRSCCCSWVKSIALRIARACRGCKSIQHTARDGFHHVAPPPVYNCPRTCTVQRMSHILRPRVWSPAEVIKTPPSSMSQSVLSFGSPSGLPRRSAGIYKGTGYTSHCRKSPKRKCYTECL